MRKVALFLSIAILILFIAGCGSQSSETSTPPSTPSVQTAPVGVTVTDTPPAGVAVLFFQLSITSATLTDMSGGTVSLLDSGTSIPVNVSQLQTDTAFIGSKNVTAGTYTGMSLTLANPQLTIFNDSGATIGSGANTCANNTVCQLLPIATPLTLTFGTTSSTVFPVTLSANSPLAFKLDIHLNTVIQPDLSINLAATNGVTLSQVKASNAGQPISAVGKLMGTVGTPGTNQFPLATPEGRTFTINVNSSTTYSGFPISACSTQGFSCLASGQTVKVIVTLQTDGTLLATAVNFVQLSTQQTVIGNIIGLTTSGGNTVMDLISQLPLPTPVAATVVPIGRHLSVTVPSTGVTFGIDSGSFAIPPGLTFLSASNLQVGQTVQVVVVPSSVATPSTSSNSTPGPVGPPDFLLTASSIALEPTPITGTVTPPLNASSMTFFLATNLSYLVPPPTAAGAAPNFAVPFIITIDTTAATTFTGNNVTGISGLNVNDMVSVGGWVFSTPTGTTKVTLAAKAVVDRGQITASPLF